MLRRNIAAPSLKILWKNLNSVKFDDKSNMNVFTLSQWENFRWGLIYFDQFIYFNIKGCGVSFINAPFGFVIVLSWLEMNRSLWFKPSK